MHLEVVVVEINEGAVAFLNWSAPCLIKATSQKNQANLIGYLLHENANTLMICLTPNFANARGQLWVAEKHVLQLLQANA